MKAYHTDKDGIGIWRLSGVVGIADALTLLRSLDARENGCFIIDFEQVDHIDYRAFELLEERRPRGSKLLFSGLSDYVLDIYAFVRDSRGIAVYPDVQGALSYLTVERGKICSSASRDSRRRV
jgi:hypothetical protein